MKSRRFKIKNWGKDGSYSVEKELDSNLAKFQKTKKRKAKRKPNEQ